VNIKQKNVMHRHWGSERSIISALKCCMRLYDKLCSHATYATYKVVVSIAQTWCKESLKPGNQLYVYAVRMVFLRNTPHHKNFIKWTQIVKKGKQCAHTRSENRSNKRYQEMGWQHKKEREHAEINWNTTGVVSGHMYICSVCVCAWECMLCTWVHSCIDMVHGHTLVCVYCVWK
jgi:hypothetical protein